MNAKAQRNAVFCLTRGYEKYSWHLYKMLVVRNIFLSFFLFRTRQRKNTDFIIFHEGNVDISDQRLISRLCPIKVTFVDVSSSFRAFEGQHLPNGKVSLGYSLMCRFQYYDVWPYLSAYISVMRVDEDIILLSAPKFSDEIVFETGFATVESHSRTNQTLPLLLEGMGLREFYDQDFPYTNVFLSQPNFWLQESIRLITKTIAEHPEALSNRWGDLPVIGVALKYGAKWKPGAAPINKKFAYFHYSHLNFVLGGKEYQMRAAP